MVERVNKRDGRKEEFMPEKLVVSAVKAGADPGTARNIADELDSKLEGDVNSEDLRQLMLERLEGNNRKWKDNWQVYDRSVKKRSD